MKKTTLIRMAVTALTILSSVAFTASVFAADVSHTIKIDNQSSTALKPTNNPHVAVYNNTTACTAAGGAAVCDTVNLTPNRRQVSQQNQTAQ